jgi:NH3-dependent NAD+ synthetase
MKTSHLTKEDIQKVANRLKINIDEEGIQWILDQYENYRTQYTKELWWEIVEIMIYDLTGPILKYNS